MDQGNKMSSARTVTTKKPMKTAAEVRTENPDGDHSEVMKRLTIDIPESLHRTIKSQCAMRGTTIVDEIRQLLIQKYND